MTCMPTPKTECDFLIQLDATLTKFAFDFEFSIEDLCREMRTSRTSLHRKLKVCSGKSTSIYIREFRLTKALDLLQTTSQNISEIAYRVGFSDLAYFSRMFKEVYGQSPTELRKLDCPN